MKRYGEFALALLLDLIGAAAALLVAVRTWQTITTPRPAPQPADVLDVTGRTIDSASTALALVALAGVVAVLATRRLARRIVGGIIAVAGAGLVWRAFASSGAVGAAHARSIVAAHHKTVTLGTNVIPVVTTHGLWPVLSAVCGVLVLASGALVAWRGARWQVMSARYESQPAPEVDPDLNSVRAAASLWSALDRGEDPTSR